MTSTRLDWTGTMNQLAGTSNVDLLQAANIWAGTSNLGLIAALNIKAGNINLPYLRQQKDFAERWEKMKGKIDLLEKEMVGKGEFTEAKEVLKKFMLQ